MFGSSRTRTGAGESGRQVLAEAPEEEVGIGRAHRIARIVQTQLDRSPRELDRRPAHADRHQPDAAQRQVVAIRVAVRCPTGAAIWHRVGTGQPGLAGQRPGDRNGIGDHSRMRSGDGPPRIANPSRR